MTFKIVNNYLDGATQVNSPFYNERPENKPISLIVIHNISLPANQYATPYVEQLFTGKLDTSAHPTFKSLIDVQVSSHLFIRRDGEVIQFVPFNKRAWHAGKSSFNDQENCNDFSIGIELEGSDHDNFTEIQYQKLAEITALLKQHYPITDLTGHSDIAPNRKTDPGPYFNWSYYRNCVKDYQQTQLIKQQLDLIKQEMQSTELWHLNPPSKEALASQEPFAIDTLEPTEWLQWIFIPRMQVLIEASKPLPQGFALHPYFEEVFKNQDQHNKLLSLIKQLDDIAAPEDDKLH